MVDTPDMLYPRFVYKGKIHPRINVGTWTCKSTGAIIVVLEKLTRKQKDNRNYGGIVK